MRRLVEIFGDTPMVTTTGFTSREMFELRDRRGEQGQGHDFLTVGSMGHCSSIALGIALAQPEQDVVCVDGDAVFEAWKRCSSDAGFRITPDHGRVKNSFRSKDELPKLLCNAMVYEAGYLPVVAEIQILLLGDSTLLADDHTLAEYSLPSSEPMQRLAKAKRTRLS